MLVTLVVAIIAALASVVAAVVAYVASQRAITGARDLANLNHRIAAHDRATEQFRTDYAGLFTALGAMRSAEDGIAVMAAAEVLAASPLASRDLQAAAIKVGEGVASRGGAVTLSEEVTKCREAVRATLEAKATERHRMTAGGTSIE